jgi:carboxypeptidase C (cathepsin A)
MRSLSRSARSPYALRVVFRLLPMVFAALLFALISRLSAHAQPPAARPDTPAATPAPSPSRDAAPMKEPPAPVERRHQITLRGTTIEYLSTTGMMPLKNDTGEIDAHVFFVAYTRVDAAHPTGDPHRPLVVAFNGGPGSASVWLHLGALGPKRVQMNPDGGLPAAPYHLIDNAQTWLDQADLVFLDPVGTGYSRPTKPEYGKKFWGVQGDIAAAGDFIRLYLTRYKRWTSPLFLAGESYGTTRAAGLSNYLVEHGIALNGVVLISTVLNFQTLEFASGNDLPYMLFLPTYTAAAWHHHKLAAAQQKDLNATLREVEAWAQTDYASALAQGDHLSSSQRQAVIDRLARYTGLSKTYLDNCNLRVEIEGFCKELLRDRKRTVGRLDSRFIGIDSSGVSEFPDFDPSMAAIRPPYTALFYDYARGELGYVSDEEYYVLGGGIRGPWDWGTRGQGYANVSEALRSAFAKNPYMRLFVASGYFDLATPYFATQYTLAHLGLDPSLRGNVTTGQYEAGHMMYIDERSLTLLKRDVDRFLQTAVQSGVTPQSAVVGPTSGRP